MSFLAAKNALILSGGGARGAYQVGVLKALTELLPESMGNPFPIICGTSAGAINAATLAAHEGSFKDAVAAMETVWSNLEPGDIYRYGFLETLRGLGRFASSLLNQGVGIGKPIALLDNSPLRSLIKRTIDFENIDRAIARGDLEAVSITAMGYSSGRSMCFFQGQPHMQDWGRHHHHGRRTLLGVDHLMASSAIPALFPTTRIEHEFYGDGALRQLAPISPALRLGATRVFVIGVSGNRDPSLIRRDTPVRHSPSMAQIIGHMLNSAFLDSLECDIGNLQRINRLIDLIPEEKRSRGDMQLRRIDSLVVSPTEQVDKIASRKIRYLPKSLRLFLRTTGATTSGGAAAASYLLFAKPFIDELIALGYRDTMWDADRIHAFFAGANWPPDTTS